MEPSLLPPYFGGPLCKSRRTLRRWTLLCGLICMTLVNQWHSFVNQWQEEGELSMPTWNIFSWLQNWRWFQVHSPFCENLFEWFSSVHFMQRIKHSLCNALTNLFIVYAFELSNLHACNSILELEPKFLCCNHGDIWFHKQCCEYTYIWSWTIGW
jgi:hypothetical protein